MKVQCEYDDTVQHEYPDDWVFGGANGTHPGADPRNKPSAYYYYDKNLALLWVTSVPTCDEEAIDYGSTVAVFKNSEVAWIQVVRDHQVTSVPETLVSPA